MLTLSWPVSRHSLRRGPLTMTLPDRRSLDTLAQTLARLMLAGDSGRAL